MSLGRLVGQDWHTRTEVLMLLKQRTAVVYGAAGSVGAAVARAFAREGAAVFLAGRRLARVRAVAEQIEQAGVGSFGIACAAVEGLTRSLAAELGPYGIRVVCLPSMGSPDAP